MTSTVTYEGDLRTIAQHLQSGSGIETDAPTDNQGKGERFSPTDLVATALGSCMMTIMGIKARDLGVDLRGLKIDITKHMAADPRRISGIDVGLHFPPELSLDDKQRVILERAALTCPVMQSIHPDIKVNTSFSY
ncbi:OsmC family protein [Dinghuibacter silviterrae]|uniref:Putative OsmC-like protein n=1 Tax=Dinghuibacter silviterrae TaxID=1539049 RepID=A0A4R8DUE9_9BACT|nr:OsmC family protein [Dinghuibacter silviterrae]TDX01789.1 putative OsmC-like protein [Dinghuibacter silviterrae]